MKQHVEAAADRVVCVVGGPGEGKSTLAAMMLENVGDAFVHAAHFCKRTDTNRQVRGSHTLRVHKQLSHAFVAWAATNETC